MKSIDKIVNSAVIVFLGIIFSKIASYLFRMIVARTDIELYGIYNLAFIIVGSISFLCALGMGYGIKRYAAYYIGKGEREKIDNLVSAALNIVVPLTIISSVLIFVYADNIAAIFHSANLAVLLRFFSILIPIISLNDIFSSLLLGHGKTWQFILSNRLINGILMILIAAILFALGYRIAAVTFALLIASLVTVILTFSYSRRLFKFKITAFHKELLFFSLPILFVIMMTGVLQYTDTLILGYFTNVREVALYNVALPTSQLLFLFSASLLIIFLPIITEKYARKENIKFEYVLVHKWIFILTLPLALLMVFFSKEVLVSMFGPEYGAAGLSLSVLSFCFFFGTISKSREDILMMLQKTKLLFYLVLITFIINIVLNIALIPVFDRVYGQGMFGSALATGFSVLILSFLEMFVAYKHTKIRLFNIGYVKILLAGLISVIYAYGIRLLWQSSGIIYLALFSISYFVLYGLLVIVLKVLDNDDKSVLRSMKNRAVSKIAPFWLND